MSGLEGVTGRYPLDARIIEKGDYIPPSMLGPITGFVVGSDEYRLRVLKLRDELESSMEREGKPCTVRFEKDGLRVLTDEEAVDYSASRHRHSLRGLGRAISNLRKVDISRLSAAQVENYNRQEVIQGRTLGAITKMRSSLPLLPHERTSPGLVDEAEEEK